MKEIPRGDDGRFVKAENHKSRFTVCTVCGVKKRRCKKYFHVHRKSSSGFRAMCKECCNRDESARYWSEREKELKRAEEIANENYFEGMTPRQKLKIERAARRQVREERDKKAWEIRNGKEYTDDRTYEQGQAVQAP